MVVGPRLGLSSLQMSTELIVLNPNLPQRCPELTKRVLKHLKLSLDLLPLLHNQNTSYGALMSQILDQMGSDSSYLVIISGICLS